MRTLFILCSFLPFLLLHNCCTPLSRDPYQTGSLVECCAGSHKTLNNWDPADPNHWYYLCQADTNCTLVSQDPYQSGSLVECCSGSHKVLNNWDSLNPSRWYYICQADSIKSLNKGIALIPNNHNCGDIAALGANWFYNWGINETDCGNTGKEFVPMIWGSGTMISIPSLPPSEWILGFNEPNQVGQANISPADAAGLWPQLQSINRKLVAPAVAMGGTMLGTTWYQQFFQSCNNCRVDAIAIHIYENNLEAFQYWVGQFKQFNKPIWITEWAFPNFSGSCTDLMAQVLNYFKSEPLVQRIGFFGSRLNGQFGNMGKCSLMNPYNIEDLSLTPTGQ